MKRQAFSLIELVIAIGILAVGLVGSLRVFPVGLRASRRSEVNSRSAMAAQRVIESLKLRSWETLTDGETVVQEDEFKVTTQVASSGVARLVDPSRLKRVDVIIEWEQEGSVRRMAVSTYARRDTP
jgi:prepilin-type N-terminal cleavage/methylation domain-containing protein